MPAIYDANCYCDSCADAIRASIRADLLAQGVSPEEIDSRFADERDYDSSEYPKYMSDDEESDAPCHCGSGPDCLEAETLSDGTKIGALLSTSLTPDGIEYVIEAVADGGAVADFWRDQFSWIDFPEPPIEERLEAAICAALTFLRGLNTPETQPKTHYSATAGP